jgi:hypothetical protein
VLPVPEYEEIYLSIHKATMLYYDMLVEDTETLLAKTRMAACVHVKCERMCSK